MSVKLTKDTRNQIRRKLLENRFEAEEAALRKQEDELPMFLYEASWTKKEAELRDSLPEGWLNEQHYFDVKLGATIETFYFKDQKDRRIRYKKDKSHYRGVIGKFDADSEEFKRWKAIRDARDNIVHRRRELEVQIDAVLSSATTADALIKKWPEIKDIVDKIVGVLPKTDRQLAVRMEKLNRDLELA